MNNNNELKWDELKNSYQPSEFSFTTTKELVESNEIIGQERALNALDLGLKMNAKGYNLYVCGECGVGKLNCIMNKLAKRVKNMNAPDDICYIYNFVNPEIPRLVLMHAGDGKKFKEDMDEFIQFIINEVPLKMQSYEMDKKRQVILDDLEDYKEELILELSKEAEGLGIVVKTTKDGIGFAPLGADGDTITKEEYNNLSKQAKDELDKKLKRLYNVADDMLQNINEKEKVVLEELNDLDAQVVLDEVGSLIKYLKEKYKQYSIIDMYLEEIGEDLLGHLEVFVEDSEEPNKGIKDLIPWIGGSEAAKLAKRYRVNLLVDHSESDSIPIITSAELGSYNLNGKILLDNEFNMLHSDFANIRSGLFHKANGGYLVLEVQALLEHSGAWMTLKQVLKTGYVTVENAEDMNIATVSAIKPEPLKVNVKVILVGSYMLYRALKEYDEDFEKLFKKRIDFEGEIKSNVQNIEHLGSLIKGVCEREGLPPVSIDGIVKICEFGNRLVGHPEKLPANLENLLDLVREAGSYADEVIDAKCISEAIKERQLFKRSIEEKIDEQIMDRSFLIDTEGEKVGQINGLAVYTIDEYMFGRPVRITATTYRGKLGIIDIEKECGLSGEIHTKGIQIIAGFLGYHFAQDMPLSLSCSICFEQSYSEIDGDSASSAELYAILSSLSEVPIKQNISATGSVNQYGQIQPIGGVNEKIEGFFKICQKRGLKGNEGVIIPIQNKKELLLDDEIIEAVKNSTFHIYSVSTIEEGMEIITGCSYKEIQKAVKQKLQHFNEWEGRMK